MKNKLVLSILLMALTGCGQQQPAAVSQEKPVAEVAPEAPVIDHYYSMKDGYEYGYEMSVSQDDANAGQVASKLLMFKYAGQKDNIYQVFSKDQSGAYDVIQCENPCKFFKEMIFYDGRLIKVERMSATEGSLGWSVLSDAINNKLEQYIGKNKSTGQKVNLWFDEENGMTATPIPDKTES